MLYYLLFNLKRNGYGSDKGWIWEEFLYCPVLIAEFEASQNDPAFKTREKLEKDGYKRPEMLLKKDDLEKDIDVGFFYDTNKLK